MKSHVAYALKILAKSFPSWAAKMGEDGAEVWSRLLEDLEPEALVAAAIQFCRESQFEPKPANLIALARPQIDPILAAVEAWNRLRSKAHGTESPESSARPVDMSALFAANAIGGVRALREAKSSDVGYLRSTFLRVYEAHMRGQVQEALRAEARALLAEGAAVDGKGNALLR